jgi:homoprotocatechuate degradation regulator HpaR
MTMREFSRSLPMLLLRSHQAVMAQFRPVLRRHGITEQQWRVLRALSSVDEARITRLAEMTLISKPSLSRLLPALEARRLVRRSAAADDLRGASIRIAQAGLALIDAVSPHSEARYREIETRVGDDAVAALYALLPRLAERLEAPRGPIETEAVPAPAVRRPGSRRPEESGAMPKLRAGRR